MHFNPSAAPNLPSKGIVTINGLGINIPVLPSCNCHRNSCIPCSWELQIELPCEAFSKKIVIFKMKPSFKFLKENSIPVCHYKANFYLHFSNI